VEDLEPKYGLAVIGLVHPDKIWKNNTAQAGDKLILTKPLGTGILGTAQKRGMLGKEARDAMVASMLQLNKLAAEVASKTAEEMLTEDDPSAEQKDGAPPVAKRARREGHRLGAELKASAVPLLPQARELAADDQCVPGGSLNNLQLVESSVRFAESVPRDLRLLLADAQTSGGLLLAVAGKDAARLVAALREAGLETSAEIGEVRVMQEGEPAIVVT